MPQLTFKWPVHTSYAAEDFIISKSNTDAARFIDSWPEGSSYAALLSGPPSSGKTHLAKRWAARVGAITIDKTSLGSMPSADLWQSAHTAMLEDIHTIADQTALFHLLRQAETQGLFLLLSSCVPVKQLGFTLPDLRSRLLAFPACQLLAPDEDLLRGFLMKCFADRQLRVGDDVIRYLTPRIDRSFSEALIMVNRIENISIETKRGITIPLIKPLLESHA